MLSDILTSAIEVLAGPLNLIVGSVELLLEVNLVLQVLVKCVWVVENLLSASHGGCDGVSLGVAHGENSTVSRVGLAASICGVHADVRGVLSGASVMASSQSGVGVAFRCVCADALGNSCLVDRAHVVGHVCHATHVLDLDVVMAFQVLDVNL